jgi:pSer/pThr/pTyr-binding forkhead associated (FHA) protein
MKAPKISVPSLPSLRVVVEIPGMSSQSFEFSRPFRIGRTDDCDVCVDDEHVSRTHAEVTLENGSWWISDLNSTNGLYIGDQRFESVAIAGSMTIKLGIYGPAVFFDVVQPTSPEPPQSDNEAVVARYIEHYFGKAAAHEPVGEHTMFVRRAFAHVQTKQKKKYGYVVSALLVCAILAGVYAIYERQQVNKQKAMAEDLFYAMKSLDVDMASLEKTVLSSNDQQAIGVIRKDQERRRVMERSYDQFLATLDVYNPKMSEQEKLIMRIARIFGECELDMPPDFEAEVNRYIKLWQSSGRFRRAINTAKENGYIAPISKEFLDQGLPPQFLYLAMQESDFDPYISGPITRKGIAKGMWQFIPETAVKYDLRVGPLVDLRRPDPADDRHHWDRETKAAAEYIRDLYGTDAQASGLLVMACYNWGENQVLPLVRSMPPNPRERNFWQLLARHRDKIPQETYDYVFYIISAAVIGENPRLFGFDFDNPLADLQSMYPAGAIQPDVPGPAVRAASLQPTFILSKDALGVARLFPSCPGQCVRDELTLARNKQGNLP